MSKKFYIILAFSTILITSLGILYKTEFDKHEIQKVSDIDAPLNKTKRLTQQCTSENKSVVPSSTSQNAKADASALGNNNDKQSNQLTILNLWYTLENHDENIAVRLDPRIKEARKIGFNSRIISVLKKNDQVQLPMINDKKYLLEIKSISKNKNNDVEIYGELDHNGKIYASTLSLTKKVVLALLTTPSGHFDVRMANDKGYIYQSDQLEDIESVVDLPSLLLN